MNLRLSPVCALIVATVVSWASVENARAVPFIPVGVQQNVPVSTVINTWEWSVVYQDLYGTFDVPISTVFAGVQPTDYVMYAAKPVGSQTFTLLAAALASDVRTYTPADVTTTSNGAEWYYNAYSMGFAGLGDTILQSTADVRDSSLGSGVNGHLRLSWHTGDFGPDFNGQTTSIPPNELDGGWRAGYTDELNYSLAWERYVLVNRTVPEPTSLTVLLLGVSGLSCFLRTRR